MGGIAFNKVFWEHEFKIWAALPLGRVALSPLFRWAKVQGVYGRLCCYIGLTAVVGPCVVKWVFLIGNHAVFGLLYVLTF